MADGNRKVAIVTGASRGIGFAIAAGLVETGYAVAISARGQAGLERAARELGGEVAAIPCDVRSHTDCQRLVEETVARCGRLDVLVNNAGVGDFGHVAELTPERWDAVLETNLSGVYYCCHAAIPHLRRAGEAWIINIGSLAGRNAFPGGAAYNASKFGLIGFSEALMQDVRHEGIRVSCIMPGSVATEFSHPRGGSADWKIQPQDIAQIVLDLLAFPGRTLPSRIEVRPSRPK
jgi:3-oxoacyl-[acyl-carrier protein] reductase